MTSPDSPPAARSPDVVAPPGEVANRAEPVAATPGEPGGPASQLPSTEMEPVVAPFRPLSDAQEGEWARYASMDGRELRYDVVKVTGAAVTTRVTVYDHGKSLGLPALREDPRDYDPAPAQPAVKPVQRRTATETIDLAGRSWKATLYETRWMDEGVAYVRRLWVSEEAPVFGLVRMELTGDGTAEARLELEAFGRAWAR